MACQRYIKLNPVRGVMVDDPADYIWSSYRAHAMGCQLKMWQRHPKYLVLGNENFRQEVEQLTGQRQHHLKRGPKAKTKPHPRTEFLL